MAAGTIISPNGTTSAPAAPIKVKKERKAKAVKRVYRVVQEGTETYKIHIMVNGTSVATIRVDGQNALEQILWEQFLEANGEPVTVEVKTL